MTNNKTLDKQIIKEISLKAKFIDHTIQATEVLRKAGKDKLAEKLRKLAIQIEDSWSIALDN